MTISIAFQRGSLAGRVIEIPRGGSVAIGRSHTCDVRAAESDVSSRHVVISRTTDDTLVVEVISVRRTLLNEDVVRQGDSFPLRPGDVLTMGSALSCQVGEVGGDGQTVAAASGAPSGDQPTVPPGKRKFGPAEAPAEVPAEAPADRQETVAIKTRLASDEELDAIRDLERRRRSRRTLLVLVPLVAFAAGAASLYFALRPKTEDVVTWPADANGKFLNHALPLAPYLGLTVPEAPDLKVIATDSGLEVWTRTGLRRDVSLHVEALTDKSPDFLEVGRERAFEAWLHTRRQSDPSFNPSVERRRIWTNRNKGNGVLFNSVSYVRRIGEEDWYGHLLFTRYEDAQHAIFIEVPLHDRYRAAPFLTSYLADFCFYAPRRVPLAWEGADDWRRETPIAQDLDEAEVYLRSMAPALWEKCWYLLCSALIKAKKAGDETSLQTGRRLLRQLREDQGTWYATQKLSWEYAVKRGRQDDIRSVQTLGETVFSAEFRDSDCRYESIRRKEWK